MKTMKWLGGILAVAVLAACSSPTSGGTKSSTVYDLGLTYSKAGDTAGKHPGLTIQIKPNGAGTQTDISQAVVVFSISGAAITGGLDGASWLFNGSDWNKAWSDGTVGSIGNNKWTTATLTSAQIAAAYASGTSSGSPGNTNGTTTTVTSVGGDVELTLWSHWTNWADISGGHVYVKSVQLKYSDGTTETLTPDSSYVGVGDNAWRLSNWSPDAGSDGATVSAAVISTVSF
jgi:hypothetical protein